MAEMSHPEQGSSQANSSESRPIYEVGFHLVPTIGEDAIAGVVEKLKTALGSAEIISERYPTKLMLAYQIERSNSGKREKYNEAYFGAIKFATEREAIPAFEQLLRSMSEILRYLLIETVREDIVMPTRRAVFTSDRLEGETLKKPVVEEKKGEVSEEELEKSIEALTS